MLSLLLAACAPTPTAAEDVTAYAAIVGEAGQDPRAELERCARLADAGLRGDCAAVVATAAARADGQVQRWCAEVPAGIWRDECLFRGAEGRLTQGGSAPAAALCQQAGSFAEDCMVHVWRPQLGRIVQGMGAEGFAARYPAAEQLYQQTVAQAGASESLERMYWLAFFGSGFQADGRIDLDRCAALPAEGARRCQDAAALMLTEPLEGLLRARGQLATFCASHPPRSLDVAGLLGIPASEALDRALSAQQPMICGTGDARPALGAGLRTGQPR